MRKLFQVYINETTYQVYELPNRRHNGYNDTPASWWLYYSEQLPGDLMPPEDSEYFQPFESSISRRVWNVNVKQRITTKIKWGDVQFRTGTWVTMDCNGKHVYEFPTSGGSDGIAYAFARVQVLMVQLSEHPFDFFDPDKEHGRKICWYGLPAFVSSKGQVGSIGIVPDYEAGFTKAQWWDELKRRKSVTTKRDADDIDWVAHEEEHEAEAKEDDYINWGDPLSDGNIYWFRK